MTRILVTGATGFIGKPLLARIAASAGEVHAIARSEAPPERGGVRTHALDLRDPEATARVLAEVRPELLVHLAWYVEHGSFWTAPENLESTALSLQLLRAFADAGGRRAVMVGTCAEYDWSRADGPLQERSSPLGPATLYGTAKDALRRLGEAYADVAEIDFAWARLFFLYGPGEQPGRLVPAVIHGLLAGEPVETTAGAQRRDFMFVEDVAGALAALAASDVIGPVNIATGRAVPVHEVVQEIARQTGREDLLRIGALPDRPSDPPLLVGASERLREEVGFVPETGLEQGIARTVDWWRGRT